MKRLHAFIVACTCACGLAAPALGASPAPAEQQQQLALAAKKTAKILVRENGWYRVSAAQLRSAGFAIGTKPSLLQLYAEGKQVPIRANRGAIEFYGTALDTPTTDAHVYWLTRGTGAGLRVPVVRVKQGSTAAFARSFPSTLKLQERAAYVASVRNGEESNIFGPVIFPGKPLARTLVAKNANPAATDTLLEVSAVGLSLKQHVVKVELNGTPLGTFTFAQQARGEAKLKVPAGVLKEGANALTVAATAGETDFVLLDTVRLTYARAYVADGDVLEVSVRPRQPVRIDGFTSARMRVVDVTDPLLVKELAGTISKRGSGFAVSLPASAKARTLLAFAARKARKPAATVANRPSKLNASTGAADLVVISHRDFMPSLKPLVALREQQGYRVALIDVADVYDEFSYGTHTHAAIRDFLAWTKAKWQRAPGFVLLVGDSSYDPRNRLGFGDFDFVPTKLVDTVYLEAPSDDSLADFDDDGVPEMAVGRLPVRTVAEAVAVVAKLVTHQQRPLNQGRAALLVSDKSIDYDFEAASRSLFGLIPQGMAIQTLNRAQGPTDAAVKARLLEALNRGPTVVNFFGHGSPGIWTGGSIFTIKEAPLLTNASSLSLYLMMTCLNGYFVDPEYPSLAESLLLNPRGGAFAVWASSGETVPTDQIIADQHALRLLLNDPAMTLGQAMLQGKAAIRDVDVRRTWVLFGDPTATLR